MGGGRKQSCIRHHKGINPSRPWLYESTPLRKSPKSFTHLDFIFAQQNQGVVRSRVSSSDPIQEGADVTVYIGVVYIESPG